MNTPLVSGTLNGLVDFQECLVPFGINERIAGDVVFSTSREGGSTSHSFLEWRVKQSLKKDAVFVSLAMKPDGYAGPDGSPTNYMSFDLETAIKMRDKLNQCIEFAASAKSSS